MAVPLLDGEHDEHMPAVRVFSHGIEPRFRVLRIAVGQDERCSLEKLLDFRPRYAVPAAFQPIAAIALEACDATDQPRISDKCLYISTHVKGP